MDIGIIANPASGKDIRRLTARASVFDNQEKSAIVRRCAAGIKALFPDARILYYPDSHNIAQAALHRSSLKHQPLDMPLTGQAEDSTVAAEKMSGVRVVISLGGDGTNRAIAKGIDDVPLIALSTGTNNAFPIFCEATVAGMAAALIATERVDADRVAPYTKSLHVSYANGESDLALVDVVGTVDHFYGTRGLLDPSRFVFAALSIADPSKVGMASIGGFVLATSDEMDQGISLEFARGEDHGNIREWTAPIAPGVVKTVRVKSARQIMLGENVSFSGATMLALDGERERILKPEEEVSITLKRFGPRRVDVRACMEWEAIDRELEWLDREVDLRDAN